MLNLKDTKFFFYSNEPSVYEIHAGSIEHAYLAILNNDLFSAKKIFALTDSPRSKWGKTLTSILEGYMDTFPTFFQIRNFLEIDLDFLLKNEKINYVEQILGSLEILAEINQETYKFAARVMFENKLYSTSLKYMEKSKKIHYADAELHFMLSKYYIQVHDYTLARHYIDECLKLLPDYYPAILLKEKIEEFEN